MKKQLIVTTVYLFFLLALVALIEICLLYTSDAADE